MATIAENIQRIQAAKASLKTQIEAKGVTVPSSATIDTYPTYVSQIPAGGGDDSVLRDLIEGDITSLAIPSSVTSIGDYVFYFCSSLTSVTIPDSVTSIGNYGFYYCSGLTSVIIPSGVTSIGNRVFQNCYNLSTIAIPSGVTSIGNYAFASCSGLTSVTIGSGVTSIGERAFWDCTGLESVTVEATTPPTLGGANVFSATNNCPIYVPAESVEIYKAAQYWSNYPLRIQAITE